MNVYKSLCSAVLICSSWGAYAENIAVLATQKSDGTGGEAQITEVVTNVLGRNKHFIVVERSQLNSVMGELKLQNSGIVDDRTAASIGHQSGAQLVAISSYSSAASAQMTNQGPLYRLNITLNLRFVDVQTGAVTFTRQILSGALNGDKTALVSEAITDLSTKLEREVANAFPTVGYIIKANSESEYVVDIGKSSGVSLKDEFFLYVDGEDIVHPVTGKVIKGEKKILAEGIVISLSDETSTIRAARSGSNYASGIIEVGHTKIEAKPKKKGLWEAFKDLGNGN